MLVLEPKRNQKIILTDSVSGAVVSIRKFRRDNGNIALGIEAPRTVKIIRESRNGENDLHISVYNFRTGGCHDGLMRGSVNLNQGAESTLSFLLSLLVIVESYAAVDKIAGSTDVLQKKTSSKSTRIKTISAKTKPRKNQVEELA